MMIKDMIEIMKRMGIICTIRLTIYLSISFSPNQTAVHKQKDW